MFGVNLMFIINSTHTVNLKLIYSRLRKNVREKVYKNLKLSKLGHFKHELFTEQLKSLSFIDLYFKSQFFVDRTILGTLLSELTEP